MEAIQILDWVAQNKLEIIELILALIGAASIIVKWTPTPKDDKILGHIKNFVSRYIALNPTSLTGSKKR